MDQQLKRVVCLTPVYNDWESFAILSSTIEKKFSLVHPNFQVEIVAVNDGSLDEFRMKEFTTALPIEIITLKNNVGHQRAIAVGLQYVNGEKENYDYVVVLDSDGEDRPEDIHALVDKCRTLNDGRIIFAQRKKRQESALFKLGYFFYKMIFFLLTGQKISFGNFSCVPKKLLRKIVVFENLWNHYSGSVIQSKLPYDKVLIDRSKRYAGKSKMNSTNLILHGLSSISVYFDFLSVRILKVALVGVVICLFSVFTVLYFKIFTDLAIPGWASNLILIIFSIILQLSSVTLIVLLMQLSSRKNIKSPPADIYKTFIDSIHYSDNNKSDGTF